MEAKKACHGKYHKLPNLSIYTKRLCNLLSGLTVGWSNDKLSGPKFKEFRELSRNCDCKLRTMSRRNNRKYRHENPILRSERQGSCVVAYFP